MLFLKHISQFDPEKCEKFQDTVNTRRLFSPPEIPKPFTAYINYVRLPHSIHQLFESKIFEIWSKSPHLKIV